MMRLQFLYCIAMGITSKVFADEAQLATQFWVELGNRDCEAFIRDVESYRYRLCRST